ncbi:mevalonate kinase [Leptotrichia shahii]|jgi:mevalonate kinase|uniref:Mevalonate kinase n=1 Tax=Leptotrichia shahii TaxID=157691 RepID=A0A510JQN9_9FUSO|nr:mevalonate kinase [Leptotrichia shahii]BBM41689.1 mevalonate kinase [Leptotrichia shahii]
MKRGIGKSHSKIILIGEHSVVYGYPAIAIPLRKIGIECIVEDAKNSFFYNKINTLSVAIFTALKHLKKENAKIKYKITSQIPQKRGMGSSAAVSIAAIRAIFDYFEEDLTDELLEKLVNTAEIVAHQTPSGLDAKTCLSDKAIKFIKNKEFSYIDLNLDAYLVIADTGIYGKTSEAIQSVKNLGSKADIPLKKLGDLTDEMAKILTENSKSKSEMIDKAGKIMTKANTELGKLNITIEKTDLFVKTAIENGASGAKISGGGLGGCVIALAKNLEIVEKIKDGFTKCGAENIWVEKI